ncbi:MAG: glycosyltransferase family 4 protein [Alphaproteobacteria bacterium]|nr:glycosyltransferase family 4 protein [Alphaproteobacteria bacterium]
MKKLLFIGHSYHKKTKSADFIINLLKGKYEIETFYFDPYNDEANAFEQLKNKTVNNIVLWQIAPNIEKLISYVKTDKITFFPMYDASRNEEYDFWYSYKNVKIINFSMALHKKLKNMGLDSKYIQYFPKPEDNFIKGDEKNIYFWQRINKINVNVVEKLFSNLGFDKLHIHNAIDPQHSFVKPHNKIKNKIEYSTWYDKKEDMKKDIQSAQIYIAPREFEGIGMSFLEAMAMGKCVIAPNYPTMNEYIIHNQNGVLYDLSNPQPLNYFDPIQLGKNAYDSIKLGYQKWENDKSEILKWIEEPVTIDENILKNAKNITIRYKLFKIFPILSFSKKNNTLKISLLKFIPLFSCKRNGNNYKINLIGIPFLETKNRKNNKIRIYFIFKLPILKETRKTN